MNKLAKLPPMILSKICSELAPADLRSLAASGNQQLLSFVSNGPGFFWQSYARMHPHKTCAPSDKKWLLSKYASAGCVDLLDYRFLWKLVCDDKNNLRVIIAMTPLAARQRILDKLYHYVRNQYAIDSNSAKSRSSGMYILEWAILCNRLNDAEALDEADPDIKGYLSEEYGYHLLEVGIDYFSPELITQLVSWDVDAFPESRNLFLKIAILTNNVELLLRMLQHGTSLNLRNSLFLYAAKQGANLTIINALIEHGVNYNIQDRNGVTALHLAAGAGSIEVFNYLTTLINVDFDAVTPNGVSILGQAVFSGGPAMVSAVLPFCRNISAIHRYNQTPYDIAMKLGKSAELALLLNKDNQKCHYHDESLFSVIRHDDVAVMRVLIANGLLADRVMVTEQGVGLTVINAASASDSYQCLQLLLNTDVHVDWFNEGNRPYTWHVIHKDYHRVFEVMLKSRFGIRYLDQNGDALLHATVLRGAIKCTQVLLRFLSHAEINAVNNQGTTALRDAVNRGNHIMIKLLLDHGANPNIGNHRGTTPLFSAADRGDLLSVQLLLKAGADVELTTTLTREMMLDEITDETAILNINGYCNQQGGDNFTLNPLQVAGLNNHQHVVAALTPAAEPESKRLKR